MAIFKVTFQVILSTSFRGGGGGGVGPLFFFFQIFYSYPQKHFVTPPYKVFIKGVSKIFFGVLRKN